MGSRSSGTSSSSRGTVQFLIQGERLDADLVRALVSDLVPEVLSDLTTCLQNA